MAVMECSIPQAFSSKAASSAVKNLQPGQSPPKSMLHVNFELDNEEMHERKKKYLTAKYGQHQMSLIRKRLSVEMWMYDQLQVLYDTPEESHYEVEIDLDELLDIESEPARREWLKKKLVGVKQSEDAVEKFITELLQRATTL
nr:protein phosphatase 1 regulatory subunit 14B isoform X2 [Parasteatoda tepidariorum]